MAGVEWIWQTRKLLRPARCHVLIGERISCCDDSYKSRLSIRELEYRAQRFRAAYCRIRIAGAMLAAPFRNFSLWSQLMSGAQTRTRPIGLKSRLRADCPESLSTFCFAEFDLYPEAVGKLAVLAIERSVFGLDHLQVAKGLGRDQLCFRHS
ncbi:MAG: hypothetical protein ABI561_25580 [Bradyrhizobium sp.]